MEELTLEEEFDIVHEYGECHGARIISSQFLEQYYALGGYSFIISFRKIRDCGGYGDIYEIDKIIRIYNFGE